MNDTQKHDRIAYDLYSCLVVAIEFAEGRETELTEIWVENAKKAVRDHEIQLGCTTLLYPKA